MFPLRDVIPSLTFPYVTISVIVLNALAWFLELSMSEDQLSEFLRVWGVVPGAFVPLTLLSSMFLHGGWWHVIGNMWFLWIFGDNVEDRMGHGRYIVFYLLCGVVASVGQILINPTSMVPTIGASGAIAGVMGAYIVLYPKSRVLTLVTLIVFWEVIELPAVALLGVWFAMQLFSAGAGAVNASTTGGGVAFMAHVAGFVMGALGVFVFKRREPSPLWS